MQAHTHTHLQRKFLHVGGSHTLDPPSYHCTASEGDERDGGVFGDGLPRTWTCAKHYVTHTRREAWGEEENEEDEVGEEEREEEEDE